MLTCIVTTKESIFASNTFTAGFIKMVSIAFQRCFVIQTDSQNHFHCQFVLRTIGENHWHHLPACASPSQLTSRTHLAVCHHMTSALVEPWIDRPMCLPCSSFLLPLTNSHTHTHTASPALPFTPLFVFLQRATWVVQGTVALSSVAFTAGCLDAWSSASVVSTVVAHDVRGLCHKARWWWVRRYAGLWLVVSSSQLTKLSLIRKIHYHRQLKGQR